MTTIIKNFEYKIYKARAEYEKGAASCLEYNPKTKNAFLTLSKQKKEKDKNNNYIFDWENKITFKLGPSDIGEILCFLRDKKEFIGPNNKGLFHENKHGNTILKLYKWKDTFNILEISCKRNGKLSKVRHTLTEGEIEYLETILSYIVIKMFNPNSVNEKLYGNL